jgi:hypothetical protein
VSAVAVDAELRRTEAERAADAADYREQMRRLDWADDADQGRDEEESA